MDRIVTTASAPGSGQSCKRGSSLPLRRILARRLILYLVLFSSLITLVTTTVQLYADYRRDVGALDFQFAQIEASYLQPLIQDLWVLDDAQVMLLLNGMLALPDITHLEIRHADSALYRAGRRSDGATRMRSFPLVHDDGRNHVLGTLHVEASLAGIHQRLLARVWLILASNAVKTLAVVLFVYFLIRRLVTRHLEHIAAHLAGIDPGSPGSTLSLARRPGGPRDELDVVVDTINRLQANLRMSYASLAESEARLRAVFDNSPACIALKSVDDRFVLLSRQCEKMLGGPLEASLGKRARDVLATSPVTKLSREAANEDRLHPPAREYAVQGADGCRVYLANEFPVIGEKGDLTGVGMIATDITRRRQAEEELQRHRNGLEEMVVERTAELEAANRELESFSYTVSHDLRAPLRAIDGFASLLLEEYASRLDETGRDYLERACAASRHMARLIDDLLELSRIARGTLDRSRVDLGAMAREILTRLQAADPRRDVRTVIGTGLGADADPGLIRVVLENLVGNAWKFSRDREPARIEIGIRAVNAGPAFFVRDNGVGFEMRHAGRIFSPFHRLHGAEEFEGTGIGLATVARIVHRHGGRIWAEARPGEGATFYFTLHGEDGGPRS